MSRWLLSALLVTIFGSGGALAPVGGSAAAAAAGDASANATQPDERHYCQQGWWIAETPNFRVCSLASAGESTRIARHCEALRSSIRQLWLPGTLATVWKPRCDIIAHASEAGYLRAAGRGAAQTAGSAWIEFEGNSVAVRRVDLKHGSPEALESALAHELTHVVLADRFADRPLPRWADEGMAVLADSRAKQQLHWRDLQQGLRSRSTLRVAELVGLDGYPAPHQMGVFYGQSVSLVSFLLEYGEPGQFVEFVDAAIDRGYDRALEEIYQIRGLGDLEQRWQSSLRNGPAKFVSRTPADFPVIAAADTSARPPGT